MGIRTRASMPVRKFHYTVRDLNQFGASAPKWSIVTSRHESRPTEPTPGPGHYQVPSTIGNKKSGHVIGEKSEVDYRTVTSEIDYRSQKTFPEIRPMTIGTRSRLQYGYQTDEVHEPVYMMTSCFTNPYWRGTRITERVPEKTPDPTPSPSRYNPVNPMLKTAPAFSLSRGRDLEPRAVDDSPGPGTYDVSAPIKTYTRWSERLMVKSNRWHPPENPNARPWKVRRN